MKPINFNWEEKVTVKKGNFAEDIVREYLEGKGFIVYEPITAAAHGFDKLAVKDKKQFVIAECKAKAKRKYFDDTGFNIKHYMEYKYAEKKHNIPVFIFFIDEHLEEIYGNWLSELEKPYIEINKPYGEYPIKNKSIIYFPMHNMRRNLYKLSKEQVKYLRTHSTRNYDY